MKTQLQKCLAALEDLCACSKGVYILAHTQTDDFGQVRRMPRRSKVLAAQKRHIGMTGGIRDH